MRTIVIELEPCCTTLNMSKKYIGPISNMIDKNKIRIGVKIRNGLADGILLWYCPWCGKEINLRVKDENNKF